MAGVTPSIMECRNYSVQDIMNIYGVGEESVRNFIKKHLIAGFVCGVIGGVIGQKIFKKHFKRAGIA